MLKDIDLHTWAIEENSLLNQSTMKFSFSFFIFTNFLNIQFYFVFQISIYQLFKNVYQNLRHKGKFPFEIYVNKFDP